MSDADLLDRLTTEADLCRNETADDIAALLDEAAALIRRQQQQYAMLDEVCAGLARDAARYRWLREQNEEVVEVTFVSKDEHGLFVWTTPTHDDLDAAIDSALPTPGKP